MNAGRLESNLREYYLIKVVEEKNKIYRVDAVRNKIIFQIISIIKNENFYQKFFNMFHKSK